MLEDYTLYYIYLVCISKKQHFVVATCTVLHLFELKSVLQLINSFKKVYFKYQVSGKVLIIRQIKISDLDQI